MAYNPGITDRSGELLAAGITNAAQTWADSQEKLRLTDKEIAHLKGTVEFAAQKGILKPDEFALFNTGNLAKKREIASRAGMLYQDHIAAQDRVVLSNEERAQLAAAGYLPMPVGGGRMQYLEQPWQPSSEEIATATGAGLVPVPTGRGRYNFLEKPTPQSGMQSLPIPGTNYVMPVYNGRAMGTIPTQARHPQTQITSEDIRAAKEAGFAYLNTPEGPVLRALRGSGNDKPAPFRDAADAIYARQGRGPTAEEIKHQQKYILDRVNDPKKPVPWTTTNPLGETFQQEISRLAQELKAMERPRAQAQPVRASAPSRPATRKAAPSAGRDVTAADGLPSNDSLPAADPDAEMLAREQALVDEVTQPADDGIPTLSAEEARKLPPGTRFRPDSGRHAGKVMTKGG